MRPGGIRRASWAALAGLLGGTAVTAVVLAVPAAASTTVSEVYGRPTSGVYKLAGHGWGHGHGQSQYGAQGAASIGKTADEITATYYPNTARAVQGNPTMRIKLSSDARTATREFRPASGQRMRDLATGKDLAVPTTATLWRITSDSNGLHVSYVTSAGTTKLTPTYAGPLQVTGTTFIRVRFSDGSSRDYRNAVNVKRSGTASLASIAIMPMESYLLGVVPRESLSSWAPAALQAQSIAARSYSTYKRDHVSSTATFDICDTTMCQVFMGSAKYSASGTRESLEPTSTTNAVKATAGVVRTYGGKAIFSEFSASNGGWSTDGGTPYLIAKADPWDGISNSTVHAWSAKLPVTSLECRYGPKTSSGACAKDANGNPLWRLTRLTITQRDGNGEWGGRVEAAVLDFVDGSGTKQRAEASGSGFYYARTWPTYSDGIRSRWFRIIPEYDGALVSRSTAPTLVLPPGNAKGTLTAVYRNTGNAGWPVSGLHLALASPGGGADPLAKGSTRPGAFVKNLTTPGSTTVAPGEQAQFSIALDASGLTAGTRTASYRLRIGTAALFGPTASWTIVVADPVFRAKPGAAPALVATTLPTSDGAPPALFADGRTVVVPRNGSTTLRLSSTNLGNLTWPVGSTSPVQLGTSVPRDRASVSGGAGWISSQRASRLAGPAGVAPGGSGTFDVQLNGNSRPVGLSTEAFEPVWQGEQWIDGHPSAFTVLRVDSTVSRVALTDLAPLSSFTLANAPSGKRTLVVRLRNVGRDAWQVGSEKLGTPSAFALRSGWSSSTRTPALSRNLTRPGATGVYPGEVGEWRVPVSAYGRSAGTYKTTLRAVGPSGFYGPSFALTVKVVNASFTYSYVAKSATVSVPSKGTAWTWVDVKNTSNFVWPVGGALRSTVVSGSSPSRASSWYSASRPGSLSSNLTHPGLTYVRAGEVARFRILLAGNGRAPQSRTESFGMSYDGWRSSPFSVSLSYRVV